MGDIGHRDDTSGRDLARASDAEADLPGGRSQEQTFRLQRLYEVAAALAGTLEVDRVVDSLASAVRNDVPVDGVAVYVNRERGLELAAEAGSVADAPSVISPETARAWPDRSLVLMGSPPVGALLLSGRPPTGTDADSFLQHLADLGDLSIGKSLFFERIRARAESAPLTGLRNRTPELALPMIGRSRSRARNVPLALRLRQAPARRGELRWPRPTVRPRRTLAREDSVNLRTWCDAWTREAERTINGIAGRTVHRILNTAREQLEMDLVWLSRFINGRYVFQAFAGDPTRFELTLDSAIAVSDSYCMRVLDGRLPAVLPDATADDRTADLPITRRLGLGAYVGAPVLVQRGELYGMLCAVSQRPKPTLRHRDATLLRTLAGVLSESLTAALARDVRASAFVRNAESMLDGGGMTVDLQPIVDLRTGDVVSVEALARFSSYPYSVEGWFTQAHEAGCGPEMEMDALVNAHRLLGLLPEPLSLAVNATPDVACSEALLDVVTAIDPSRVVVEITEHRRSSDPSVFAPAIRRLKSHGVRVAIDDTGTGYSDLRQILELQPDIVKLDRALIDGVDTDPVKAALVQALVSFGKDTGIQLVAEGISSLVIRDTLRDLSVDYGQGHALGPPEPSDVVIGRLTR